MVSIVIKFQRCGKKNCRCSREGKLHGPYFWAVIYKGSQKGRMKYKWIYLGKAIDKTLETLAIYFPEIDILTTHDKLQARLAKLLKRSNPITEPEQTAWQADRLHIPIQ